MTGADRMNKLLARAEAENTTLKDEVARLRALLAEWELWEKMANEDESDFSFYSLSDSNHDWLKRIQCKRSEALKR